MRSSRSLKTLPQRFPLSLPTALHSLSPSLGYVYTYNFLVDITLRFKEDRFVSLEAQSAEKNIVTELFLPTLSLPLSPSSVG
jgi:hypothetical protein